MVINPQIIIKITFMLIRITKTVSPYYRGQEIDCVKEKAQALVDEGMAEVVGKTKGKAVSEPPANKAMGKGEAKRKGNK